MIKIRRSGKFGRQMIGAGHRRSWRSRLGLLAAILAISAPVVLVGGSATASGAARVVDGPAQVVPGTTELDGIACRRHDNCLAVGSDDGEGVVVPITDGVPGTAEPVTVTTTLTAVSCPSTTFCVAVGYGPYTNPPEPPTIAGFVVTIIDGNVRDENIVPGMGMPGDPDEVYLYGVACSSTSSCLAGGWDAGLEDVILPVDNGYPQNEETVDGGSGIHAVACRRVNCLAVGNGDPPRYEYGAGVVVPDIEGMPAGGGIQTNGVRDLYGVSCRSGTSCVSVGDDKNATEGVVVTVINQTPQPAKRVSGSTVLNGVACRSTAVDCLAVGDNSSNEGVIARIYNGTSGTVHAVSGTEDLNGVACTTNTSCLIVGANSSGEGVMAVVHLPS